LGGDGVGFEVIASLDDDFTWGGYYIDMNGVIISGITPVLSNVIY
jgi:hypothetical protein